MIVTLFIFAVLSFYLALVSCRLRRERDDARKASHYSNKCRQWWADRMIAEIEVTGELSKRWSNLVTALWGSPLDRNEKDVIALIREIQAERDDARARLANLIADVKTASEMCN